MKLSNRIHNARQQRPNRTRRRTKGFPAEILAKIRKGKDVVAGKGEYIKQLNVHYRRLIRRYHLAYHRAETDKAKRAVAELVLKEIRKIGGRFLNAQYEEMERKKAKQKVMKALKDAKKQSGQSLPVPSPVLSSSTSPEENNVEPLDLDAITQNFNRPPIVSPVMSSSASEEEAMESFNLDSGTAASPHSELEEIDSFPFDLFGIDTADENPGNPLAFWAV